jgi:hypothetical protein
LNTYHTVGNTIAAFGGPDWTDSAGIGADDGKYGSNLDRTSRLGSPVVPNSAKKVKEGEDAFLYTITMLRGHSQAGYFQDNVFHEGNREVHFISIFVITK